MEVMEWRRGVLKRWSWYRGRRARERGKRHRGMTAREWRTRRETVERDVSVRRVRTET